MLVVAFALTLFSTSRILENNMLSLRIAESAQKANDFSLAVKEGLKIGGRVLVLDARGVVQVDSFSRLNGMRLSHREVQEVLTGGKGSSYGFHKIHRADGRIWSLNSSAAIMEESNLVGAVVLVQSVQDVVQSVHAIQASYYLIYLVAICILLSRRERRRSPVGSSLAG